MSEEIIANADRARSVVRNSAAQFATTVFNNILAVLASVVVVRHLGPEQYGVLAFVVSYMSFFQILTSLGIDTVIVRDVARRPEQAADLVGAAIGLRMVLSVLTIGLLCAVAPTLGVDDRAWALAALASLSFLCSFYPLLLVLFTVELRVHVPNLVLAGWSLLYTASKLVIVALGGGVAALLAADVLSSVVILALSTWISRRRSSLRPRLHVDLAVWAGLLKQGWAVALTGWLIALHYRVDQLLLYRFSGTTELGTYAVAVRMAEIWVLLANVLMTSVFPLLARDYLADQDRMRRTSVLAYRYLYAVLCPIVAALILYPEFIATLAFGEAFSRAATPLTLLAVAELFVFGNSVTYNVFFASGLQRQAIWIAAGSVLLNAALNVAWIPRWGGAGAAAASLVSYVSVPLLGLASNSLRQTSRLSLTSLVRPGAALAVSTLTIGAFDLSPWPGLLATAILVPAAILATGSLGRSDLELLQRAWRGR